MLNQSKLSDVELGTLAHRHLFDLSDQIEAYTTQSVRFDILQAVEAIVSRLHASDPHNAGYARDLSISYERLGDLCRNSDTGKAQRTTRRIWKSPNACTTPTGVTPATPATSPSAAASWATCAATAIPTRRGYYEQALEIGQRLYDTDPRNAGYARDLSISFNKLGDLCRNSDTDKAASYYEQALHLRQPLFDAYPQNYVLARELLVPLQRLAQLHEDAGDTDTACHYWLRLLDLLRTIRSRNWPLNPFWQNLLDKLERDN